MDTALPQKFPFILDRNLAKANCTENQFCMSCDIVVFGKRLFVHNLVIYVTALMTHKKSKSCDKR